MPIDIAQYRFRLAEQTEVYQTPSLERFFGQDFAENIHSHLYDRDGNPIFAYPRIQFKTTGAAAALMGIKEGAALLEQLWPNIEKTELGDERFRVLDVNFDKRQEEINASAEPLEYRFITPWIALNEKNFRSYTGSWSTKYRKDELSRIVTANCLGMGKSLGLKFDRHIEADCRELTSIKTMAGKKSVVGFIGVFKINLVLPHLIGLGKSVARGFGAVSSR